MTRKSKKPPGRRRQARELALQILYAIEMTGYDLDQTIEGYLILDPPGKSLLHSYASRLLEITLENMEQLDRSLTEVITNWKLDRLSCIDRNLLRLAAAEIYFHEDIPPKVTINEYIEIAKEFGDNDSPSFVNGILDRLVRESEKAGEI